MNQVMTDALKKLAEDNAAFPKGPFDLQMSTANIEAIKKAAAPVIHTSLTDPPKGVMTDLFGISFIENKMVPDNWIVVCQNGQVVGIIKLNGEDK